MENCRFGYKNISLKKKTELATAAVHGLLSFEGGGGEGWGEFRQILT
jgi:hypothetical protein